MAYSILVVDDEPDLELLVTQRFRSKIRSNELKFQFAHNGAAALEKLNQDNAIDVIFTDINMPVMDGLTFLTKVKDLNLLPKAVVISAYGDLDNIRTAMNRGAFDFITKPIDMTDLETTLYKAAREGEILKEGIQAKENLEKSEREKSIAIIEKQKAEESKQLEQQFLANMSHEIRTPMNAIIGMTNLVMKSELNDQQKKYLNIIKISSQNLLVIINDILDLSKIEAGKISLENVSFNLHDTLVTVYESLKLKSDEKKLEFLLTLDDRTPKYIYGDPVRISQVLINLAGNAIKFTDQGKVEIRCRVLDKNNESATLELGIIDTGIGIPEDKLPTIFEKFTQASSDTTRKYGGTGLGLTISKQLTELFGGSLLVTSRLNEGSEFICRFTFKIAEGDHQPAKQGQINVLDTLIQKDLDILLVEDNMFNQEVAVDTLKSLLPKIKIDIAENGAEAVEKAKAGNYDLIIMDVQMPVMDGYEATRTIRNTLPSPVKNTPILAMTANVIKEEIDKCFASGMNDYISKPFDPDLLINKIASLTIK